MLHTLLIKRLFVTIFNDPTHLSRLLICTSINRRDVGSVHSLKDFHSAYGIVTSGDVFKLNILVIILLKKIINEQNKLATNNYVVIL